MKTCNECFEAAMQHGGDVESVNTIDEYRHWRPRTNRKGNQKRTLLPKSDVVFCEQEKASIPEQVPMRHTKIKLYS